MKAFWASVEAKIAKGQYPKIFLSKAGRFCLDDGFHGAELPPRLAEKMPAMMIDQAKAVAAERAAGERAMAIARREELEARLEERGFTLLAGEDTTIVASGTLRSCREALEKVTRLRRDSYSGRGCWVICDSRGSEVESGYFTRNGLV